MPQAKAVVRARRDNVPYVRAILKRPTTLVSTEANRVFRRCYNIAAKNLYALDVICTSLLSYEASKNTAETLDDLFNEIHAEYDGEIARAKKLLEITGTTVDQAYSYQKNYTAEYSTPYALRYVELIELLDELIKLVMVLRATGGIESHSAQVRTYQWQQRLVRLSGRLRGLTDNMWSQIKQRRSPANGEAGDKNAESDTQELVQTVIDDARVEADAEGIAAEEPEGGSQSRAVAAG